MESAESEARRALARFRRALEKADNEMEKLRGALRHAEGEDFPLQAYDEASSWIARCQAFAEEEGDRLQEKILHAGGLEPGRVRRGGG